ncbi:MAG: EAL domain-containing protein, partial [Thermomonas sp.]
DALDMQVVLLYLDLDNFKDINDNFGHAVGDELLRGIGERLLLTLYARDSVGRLGGDEFGIILVTPRTMDTAIKVAGKIHEALSVPFELTGHSVSTSVSIGITLYPADSRQADVLARNADMAMYEAKRSGRNTSRFYTAAMNQQAGEKLQLVAALRNALAAGEFVLFYQPKVSLATGRWMGVEALLRWQRPGHGLVMPNAFIPALEDSGLIVPVGSWVVATACSQLADWRRRGMQLLPIAVNASALQMVRHSMGPTRASGAETTDSALENIELLTAVGTHTAEHALAAGSLEVELTESVIMADAEHSIEILERLRTMGVSLSVDDFGTGYSSLSYLRKFPLQAVKIDGSFIRDVTTNADDASIVVAIIEMAHRLRLKVIAECVETAEQVQFLQAHECDQAQGYYFAKPMPVAELERLWRECNFEFSDLVAISPDIDEARAFESAWPECAPFVTALLAGADDESNAIVDRKRAEGHGLLEVNQELVRPALYCIGKKWRSGQVSVAQEHVATAVALSVMSRDLARSTAADPCGKKVLLACVNGNHHEVGLQMVADAFTLAGWEVNFLGANVPGDALIEHARHWCPDLLGLSASLPEHVRELSLLVDGLRLALQEKCPPILVGGLGLSVAWLASGHAGATTWISDPQAAVAAGEQLCKQTNVSPALA